MKKLKLLLMMLIVFSVFTNVAYSQCNIRLKKESAFALQTVTGLVNTNFAEPIVNARVQLMKQNNLGTVRYFTYTDSNGRFLFREVEPCQPYVLTVEYPNHRFYIDTRTFTTENNLNTHFSLSELLIRPDGAKQKPLNLSGFLAKFMIEKYKITSPTCELVVQINHDLANPYIKEMVEFWFNWETNLVRHEGDYTKTFLVNLGYWISNEHRNLYNANEIIDAMFNEDGWYPLDGNYGIEVISGYVNHEEIGYNEINIIDLSDNIDN